MDTTNDKNKGLNWADDGLEELVFGFLLFVWGSSAIFVRLLDQRWADWDPVLLIVAFSGLAGQKAVRSIKHRLASSRCGYAVKKPSASETWISIAIATASIAAIAAMTAGAVWLIFHGAQRPSGALLTLQSFVAPGFALFMALVLLSSAARYRRRAWLWMSIGLVFAAVWIYLVKVEVTNLWLVFMVAGGALATNGALHLRAFLNSAPRVQRTES